MFCFVFKLSCQLLLTPDLHPDFQILHLQQFHYLDSNRFLSYYKGHFAPVTVFPRCFIKMSKGIIWFSSILCYMFKKKKELLISITTKFKSFIIYLANKTITLKCRKCNSMRKKTPLYRVYLLINLPKI